jgi:mannose-6-phosphate isomerase
MRGFREIPRIIDEFSHLNIEALAPAVEELEENQNPEGLKQFFKSLMELPKQKRKRVIDQVVSACSAGEDHRYRTVVHLYQEYPDDIGILAPLYLNLVVLQPGEAMFLPAGELHAYLDGTGIELMANSDNVLRGGLTSKHVDVPELLHVLTFTSGAPEILTGEQEEENKRTYPIPINEFRLTHINVTSETPYEQSETASVEVYICLEGECSVESNGETSVLPIARGESFLVFGVNGAYRIRGEAELYRASIPV